MYLRNFIAIWLAFGCAVCSPSPYQLEANATIKSLSASLPDWESEDTPRVFLPEQVILGGLSKVLKHFNIDKIIQSGWSHKSEKQSDILLHSIYIDSELQRSALCQWFTVEKKAEPVCTKDAVHIIQLLAEKPNWLDFKEKLNRLSQPQVSILASLPDSFGSDELENAFYFPKAYLQTLENCFEVSYRENKNRYFNCKPAEVKAAFSGLQKYMESKRVLSKNTKPNVRLKPDSLYLQWRPLQSNPGGEAVICGDHIIGVLWYAEEKANQGRLSDIYEKCS